MSARLRASRVLGPFCCDGPDFGIDLGAAERGVGQPDRSDDGESTGATEASSAVGNVADAFVDAIVNALPDHPIVPISANSTTSKFGTMAFKHEQLPEWIATHAPGEHLVSHVATGAGQIGVNQGGSSSTHGDRQRYAVAESLGIELRFGSSYNTTFWALTDRQLLLGTRSGMRNRPKDLLHRAAIDQVTLYWFDSDDGGGNRFRHFITDFGDGTGRVDRSGITALGRTLKSSNVDAYVHAFDERAYRIDPDSFTPPTA